MSLAPLMVLAAAAADPPICTDRPTKANAVCTVPAGRFQLESSALSWIRMDADGVRTDTLYVGSSVLKYGLSEGSDLQVGFTPYVRIRAKEAGETSSISGFGDVTVRYKHRLLDDESGVQFGIISFVKLPTAADGLGNGKLEGGLAVPVNFPAGSVAVTLSPEVDLLLDSDGSGRHLALVNLVNVSMPVAPRLTVAGELWTNFSFDPDGTVEQASLDGAIAYLATDSLQFDAGANFGLTRDTTDVEVYAGASIRF